MAARRSAGPWRAGSRRAEPARSSGGGGGRWAAPGEGGGALLRNPNGDAGRFLDFGTGFAFGAAAGITYAAWVRVDSVQNYGCILYLRDGGGANSAFGETPACEAST